MIYKFRHDRIILQGDTHSLAVTYDKISHNLFDGRDYVHLGDNGLGFGKPSYAIDNALSHLDKINKLCVKKDINSYLIRGNHDATYDKIWNSEWSNVFLIKDSAYAEFPNGKSVILVGGGISVDRCVRNEGEDYWYDEITPILKDLKKCDIMLSHDCPEYFNHKTSGLGERFQWCIDRDPLLIEDCNTQRINMSNIVKDTGVKTIFYGHFHNSTAEECGGIYGRCVNINELVEFDANKVYKL